MTQEVYLSMTWRNSHGAQDSEQNMHAIKYSRNMSHEPEKIIPAPDLKECAICARYFTLERINIHEAICEKSAVIQRKSFDISQQRTRGTEAETLAKVADDECSNTVQKSDPCGLSTNWRGKHEEFIKKVRDAKRSISEKPKPNDLPFPPPAGCDTDYVRCQHCLRQFNRPAAPRHIANCARKMSGMPRDLTSE